MKLYFELPNHHAYSITGDDAERYLQGRITQDIKKLANDTSLESILLNPQGKIQAKFNIHKTDNAYIIIADPSENFEKDLLQFKVADHVILKKLDAKIISILGQSNIKSYQSFRYKDNNFDLISTDISSDIKKLEKEGFTKGSAEQRANLRINGDKPEYGEDIDSSISATEVPYENLVSFTKGCYSGQEVVEMSIARGKPNKKLVKLESNQKIKAGDIFSTEKKEKKCGFIQTAADKIAFAYIKSAFLEQDTYYTENDILNKISE